MKLVIWLLIRERERDWEATYAHTRAFLELTSSRFLPILCDWVYSFFFFSLAFYIVVWYIIENLHVFLFKSAYRVRSRKQREKCSNFRSIVWKNKMIYTKSSFTHMLNQNTKHINIYFIRSFAGDPLLWLPKTQTRTSRRKFEKWIWWIVCATKLRIMQRWPRSCWSFVTTKRQYGN